MRRGVVLLSSLESDCMTFCRARAEDIILNKLFLRCGNELVFRYTPLSYVGASSPPINIGVASSVGVHHGVSNFSFSLDE
jgi:hypothetical protein